MIDGGLLILVVLFGILLIKSVIREVEQREKLEVLNKKGKRKVGTAFREAHPGMKGSADNVARRGCFIDATGKKIIDYKTIEKELRSTHKKKR